jgi:predicted RNA-binding protein with PUA-like domain
MLQSIKQNQAAMADSLGGCQSRTSIFPVTAAEIRAVRRS